MYNFNKIMKKIDKLMRNGEVIEKRNRIVCQQKYLKDIQLLLKKQNNMMNNPEFYVLFVVEVNDNNKRIDFSQYLWENDPNIRRIIKISSLNNHGTIIQFLTNKHKPLYHFYARDLMLVNRDNSNDFLMYDTNSDENAPIDTKNINAILDKLDYVNISGLFDLFDYGKSK